MTALLLVGVGRRLQEALAAQRRPFAALQAGNVAEADGLFVAEASLAANGRGAGAVGVHAEESSRG